MMIFDRTLGKAGNAELHVMNSGVVAVRLEDAAGRMLVLYGDEISGLGKLVDEIRELENVWKSHGPE